MSAFDPFAGGERKWLWTRYRHRYRPTGSSVSLDPLQTEFEEAEVLSWLGDAAEVPLVAQLMDHFHVRAGVANAEQVPLSKIAREVGTPVYVYSAAAMRSNARGLQSALSALDDPLIAYAVKANPNAAVLATLAAEGLGADIVSGGEYQRTRAVGIATDRIVMSGVGKTAAEMALALDGGLFQFNLESLPEAETLSQVAVALGKAAPVAFRVNPDVDAGSHAKISTGGAHDKFGIPIGEALAAFARLKQLPGLEIKGVAVHIGSQLTSLEPLESAFHGLGQLIEALRAAGHAITTADLGGGLGVSYDPSIQAPPNAGEYAAMVRRVTQGWGVRLIFEPGRLIVGNAGVLLTEVIRVKNGLSHPFVVVDAAMNDLLRPTLYDAWHSIEAVVPRGGQMRADVVGPVCESGDTFAKARTIDRVEAGDLMIIRTAGAYAATMGSTYNSRPLTPEVLVDGDRWAVVRERQDVASIIAGEKIPEWLPR